MLATAQHTLDRWLYLNPDAYKIPHHIQQCIDVLERQRKARNYQPDTSNRYELAELQETLEEESTDRAKRREAEHALADYIRDIATQAGRSDLIKISNRLSSCRMSGTIGIKPGGGHVVAWDYKCGLVRLCPDESREEQQRLTDFYLPAMMDFTKASAHHRIFYSVLTLHNFRPGNLKTAKQYLFDKFKDFMNETVDVCPVVYEHGVVKPTRARKQKLWPQIKGAFVVQEDPLSAGDDWNVHLNVFFLVKGEFNFKKLRECWGANVHVQQVKGKELEIRQALMEAIKYSAQIVPEKSLEKANDSSQAPAMTQWSSTRWQEWWDAQQGFRRTRAYGCLYALHGKRWNAADFNDRSEWCRVAGAPQELVKLDWKEIGQGMKKKDRERLRVKLRKAMVFGEAVDMQAVEWVGSMKFGSEGSYRVDLIPGDNFSGRSSKMDNFSRFREPAPPN